MLIQNKPQMTNIQKSNNLKVKDINTTKVVDLKLLKLLNNFSISSVLQQKSNSSIMYNFNRSNSISKFITNANTILNYFFGSFYCIISKPVFLVNSKVVKININYYSPDPSIKLANRYIWKYNKVPSVSAKGIEDELLSLIDILSNLLKMRVELQLNQLKYPFHDSTILARLISLHTNSTKYVRLMKVIMKKATIIAPRVQRSKFLSSVSNKFSFYNINNTAGKSLYIHKATPTILTGLKIKISGRLALQRIVPKRTISKTQIGSFASSKSNIVDYGIYTNKNKRGAYSVKV
jgi:hypothetical protein